uniref:DUF885 domain-containing protein n=1 Tax=Lachnospira sp. TaxID=2049031 RepID=UPI004025C52F
MFKRNIKKVISLTMAVVISAASISLTGCSITDIRRLRGKNNNSYDTQYSYNTTDNEAFEEFTDGLFKELIVDDTLSLHTLLEHPDEYGITDYDVTLGRIDTDSLDDTSDITQCITELTAFDRNFLSKKQTITYDYLLSYLQTRLCYSDLDLYDTQLTPTIGIQIELPLVFSEYTFVEKKDVDEYITLLCDVDSYFANLIEYENMRASKGLTKEDSLLDDIISSCQSVIDSVNKTGSSDRLFIDDFNTRIDALTFISDDEKAEYKKLNLDAINNHVIPGYQALIDGLSALKGTNRYTGGICSYPDGQRYYEGLLEQTLGWSKSVDEYNSLLEDYMRGYMLVMRKLVQKDSSLIDSLSRYSFNMTEPESIIEDLKKRITEDYPELDEAGYSIKYVSDSLRDYASPAMYFMPQIDNPDINSIYINNSGTDSSDIYPVLSHESYPGHMYQTQYFLKTNPSLIRSYIKPGGYMEGWASYVEVHSYEYNNNNNDNLNTLAKCNYALTLCLHAIGDIGVNYYGWDEARLSSYLSNWGFNSPDTAHWMYTALIANPGNYCKYVLGFIGFEELKKQAQKDLGSDFSLKEFHRYILETGPVQFDILFSNLKEWEESLVVVSSRAA